MRKLMVVLIAALFVLPAIAPPARAASGENETEARGPIIGAGFTRGLIAGLPISNQVEVELEPVVGRSCKVKNQTQGTRAEGRVAVGTAPAPSNLPGQRLRCGQGER